MIIVLFWRVSSFVRFLFLLSFQILNYFVLLFFDDCKIPTTHIGGITRRARSTMFLLPPTAVKPMPSGTLHPFFSNYIVFVFVFVFVLLCCVVLCFVFNFLINVIKQLASFRDYSMIHNGTTPMTRQQASYTKALLSPTLLPPNHRRILLDPLDHWWRIMTPHASFTPPHYTYEFWLTCSEDTPTQLERTRHTQLPPPPRASLSHPKAPSTTLYKRRHLKIATTPILATIIITTTLRLYHILNTAASPQATCSVSISFFFFFVYLSDVK